MVLAPPLLPPRYQDDPEAGHWSVASRLGIRRRLVSSRRNSSFRSSDGRPTRSTANSSSGGRPTRGLATTAGSHFRPQDSVGSLTARIGHLYPCVRQARRRSSHSFGPILRSVSGPQQKRHEFQSRNPRSSTRSRFDLASEAGLRGSR